MSLEHELAALAPSIDWPDAPDVASSVASRIGGEAAPARRRAPRRRLALVLAVVLAAVLAVLAVPPARTAVFDWLGIGGAQIVRVDELPALEPTTGLEVFGAITSLDDARARAGFALEPPPDDEPAPDEIRVASGARVSYVWREGERIRLLISQFPGSAGDPGLLKKLAAGRTRIEELDVDGDRAVWLEGGPHVVYVLGPDGSIRQDQGWLAGNTLLVDRDGVTVRIEGDLARDDAVELVRAMRD
jgi:hypothetical protein